ncbi:MAG: AAA family ATPase [Candidatus Rhabdochlamydia sp.]
MNINLAPIKPLLTPQNCLRAAQWIVCAQLAHSLVIPIISKLYGSPFEQMPLFPRVLSFYSSTASIIEFSDLGEKFLGSYGLAFSCLIFANALTHLTKALYTQKKPPIPSFLRDLSKASLNKNDLKEQDSRADALLNQLASLHKPHIMLVGNPGTGKTSLVEIIAKQLKQSHMKESPLYQKTIYLLDKNIFLSKTKYLGQFNEKIAELLSFTKRNKNAIIFIDEIHTILSDGKTQKGTSSIGESLKEALSRNEIHVIGATTPQDYQNCMVDSALNRRFQEIHIENMDPLSCMEVLNSYLKQNHPGKTVHPSVLHFVIMISSLYQGDRGQPDKALTLLDHLLNLKIDFKDPIDETTSSLYKEAIVTALSHYYSINKGDIDVILNAFIQKTPAPEITSQLILASPPSFLQDLSSSSSSLKDIHPVFSNQTADYLKQGESAVIRGVKGSGKTAAIYFIAKQLKKEQKKIYLLQTDAFISQDPSLLKHNFRQMMTFLKENKNAILCIEEIEDLLSNPVIRTSLPTFQYTLKNHLQKKEMQLLATTALMHEEISSLPQDLLYLPLPPLKIEMAEHLLKTHFKDASLEEDKIQELIGKAQKELSDQTTVAKVLQTLKKYLFESSSYTSSSIALASK